MNWFTDPATGEEGARSWNHIHSKQGDLVFMSSSLYLIHTLRRRLALLCKVDLCNSDAPILSQLQSHSSIICFVMLGLRFCKIHFSPSLVDCFSVGLGHRDTGRREGGET